MEGSSKKVLVAIFGFWIFGVLLGGIWGTYRSYKTNAYAYVDWHMRDSTGVRKVLMRGNGAQFGGVQFVKKIYLECGPFMYAFAKNDSVVRRLGNPNYDSANDRSPRTEFSISSFSAIASVLALVGVKLPTITSSAEALAQSNKWYIVVAVVGGAIGFGLGYHLTYNDAVDFNSAEFQKAANDVVFWRGQFQKAEQRLYAQFHPNAEQQ